MFTAVPVMIGIIFVVILCVIIVSAVKGVAQWSRNNNSPVLTVEVRVTAKRTDVSHHTYPHSDNAAMHHTSSSTEYYTTFEVESGDRMELRVPDKEYGMIAEGDCGMLTFQGTRYLGFERFTGE